jgi:hypothetical protein
VALAIEDHGRDLARAHPTALGNPLDDLADRLIETQAVGDLGAAGELLHVNAGTGIEHRPALGEGDHAERTG